MRRMLNRRPDSDAYQCDSLSAMKLDLPKPDLPLSASPSRRTASYPSWPFNVRVHQVLKQTF